MIISFTGTQNGLSLRQVRVLRTILTRFLPSEVHHGDCIGADFQFDAISKVLNLPIIIHPPTSNKKRAFCIKQGGNRTELTAKPYHKRNHDNG